VAGRLVLHRRGRPCRPALGHDHARSILEGRVSVVAAAIRRKATRNHLDAATRKPADTAACSLLNKQPSLDYPTTLARGWPIATGTSQGACRHLVKDRMDRTGARWAWPARRRSSSSGRYPATATSTTTGPTTWSKSSNGCTRHATPTASFPPDDHP
jgi:hypothetical protein